jgi:hypothetical protein
MKKSVLIVAALGALALAACAFVPPPPNEPQVSVVGGKYIVVSPEPLVFRADGKPQEIVWSLPKDSNFRFPANGIEIEGQFLEVKEPDQRQTVLKRFVVVPQTEIVCPKQDGGLTFKCMNSKKTKGTFKYTIRVNDGDKPLTPIDPMIGNDL